MDARAGFVDVGEDDPVVVVGSGPVGSRVVHELVRAAPGVSIVWYGDEACLPYNRVRLSSVLAGDASWDSLEETSPLPPNVDCRFGYRVEVLDRARQRVVDSTGRVQAYRKLILATGSRPHIPSIQGVGLNGVYTFRNLDDAQRLQARTVRSRVCVVIGGGLLGLEAARAMRRYHTEVWVIEHATQLMAKQLDEAAADILRAQIEAMGIRVRVGTGVRTILGEGQVRGVQLRDGMVLYCDTVVISTGILPNVELARASGLALGRGIRVDDRMLSSDPAISAVGECAEHRGEVHGLVAPGLEQAAVAATVLAGGQARYLGSISATNLKVMGCKVFSIGERARSGPADPAREILFRDRDDKGAPVFRKLLVRRGRLAGAIGIGGWPECSRVQEAVRTGRRLWPWQQWRFARAGQLWSGEDAGAVGLWPADATVCNCTGVTKGRLDAAVREGCASVEGLCGATGAGTVCGSCRPLLAELAGGTGLPALNGWRVLFGLAAVAALLAALYALFTIPFPQTADLAWRWDAIWRDGLYKQISGYTAIGLMALLAVLSLRKRWARLALWNFDGWRVVHTALGAGLVLVLFAHTGGRFGERLDFVLSLSAVVALLSGVAIASVLARQQDLAPRTVRSVQRGATWTHILSLWLLPALLGYHILKSYYF